MFSNTNNCGSVNISYGVNNKKTAWMANKRQWLPFWNVLLDHVRIHDHEDYRIYERLYKFPAEIIEGL